MAPPLVWLATAIYITVNGSIGINDFDWIVWLSVTAGLLCSLAYWALDDGR